MTFVLMGDTLWLSLWYLELFVYLLLFSCFVLLGEEAMPVLHIHRQSGYLLGRDRKVADIPVDHPSCSKQHAVLQFRSVEYTVC